MIEVRERREADRPAVAAFLAERHSARGGAVDESRARLKPELPKVGNYDIPIRDELVLEKELT